MKLNDFKALCGRRLDACTALMYGTKNKEYARNDDKLHNFKRAADMIGVTPEQALVGMWTKHLVSILDIVNDLASGAPVPDPNIIGEKFNDSHNYQLMLEALIEERRGKEVLTMGKGKPKPKPC